MSVLHADYGDSFLAVRDVPSYTFSLQGSHFLSCSIVFVVIIPGYQQVFRLCNGTVALGRFGKVCYAAIHLMTSGMFLHAKFGAG
jgi:hypothetical protein